MSQPVKRQWRRGTLLACLVVGGACVMGGPGVRAVEPIDGAVPEAAASDTPKSGAAKADVGQWIHVDPGTGRVGVLPMPARTAIETDPAFTTSHQGLIMEPAPGGGVMVDLQGRFRHAVRATVKPNGSVVTDCLPAGMPVQGK